MGARPRRRPPGPLGNGRAAGPLRSPTSSSPWEAPATSPHRSSRCPLLRRLGDPPAGTPASGRARSRLRPRAGAFMRVLGSARARGRRRGERLAYLGSALLLLRLARALGAGEPPRARPRCGSCCFPSPRLRLLGDGGVRPGVRGAGRAGDRGAAGDARRERLAPPSSWGSPSWSASPPSSRFPPPSSSCGDDAGLVVPRCRGGPWSPSSTSRCRSIEAPGGANFWDPTVSGTAFLLPDRPGGEGRRVAGGRRARGRARDRSHARDLAAAGLTEKGSSPSWRSCRCCPPGLRNAAAPGAPLPGRPVGRLACVLPSSRRVRGRAVGAGSGTALPRGAVLPFGVPHRPAGVITFSRDWSWRCASRSAWGRSGCSNAYKASRQRRQENLTDYYVEARGLGGAGTCVVLPKRVLYGWRHEGTEVVTEPSRAGQRAQGPRGRALVRLPRAAGDSRWASIGTSDRGTRGSIPPRRRLPFLLYRRLR